VCDIVVKSLRSLSHLLTSFLWGTENAGHKIARNENAAQNCRGGKCETWKMRHKNATTENAGKVTE